MKQDWKPGTMIYPLPALLVSCGSTEEEYNIITVACSGCNERHEPRSLHGHVKDRRDRERKVFSYE